MGFTSYGQDRVDKKLPSVTLTKSLSQSIGWNLSKSGQWKSRPNRIPKVDVDNILLDYESYGLGEDNFLSLQFGEIKIDEKPYHILTKKYKDGYYRYETIQKGWTPCLSVSYYVFDDEEYDKIRNIQFDSKNYIEVKPLCSNDIRLTITNENMLYQIKKDIMEQKADNFESVLTSDNKLGLMIYPISKQSKVRFKMEIFGRYSDEESIGDFKKSFESSYFETSLVSFNSLISISNKDNIVMK